MNRKGQRKKSNKLKRLKQESEHQRQKVMFQEKSISDQADKIAEQWKQIQN